MIDIIINVLIARLFFLVINNIIHVSRYLYFTIVFPSFLTYASKGDPNKNR